MGSIFKQSAWLFFAQAAARVIGFFYSIYLARHLGVSDFGLFSVALTYYSIFAAIADLGFGRYLVREVVKDKSRAMELVYNTSILRLFFASLIFGIFSLILYYLDPQKIRVSLSILAVMAILPQSISFSIDAVFVGLRKLQFSAVCLLVLSISTAISGLLLAIRIGAMGAVIALIIGQSIYLLSLGLFLRFQGIKFTFKLKESQFLNIIKKSLPYGILGGIGFISFKMDMIILSYLKGNFETGIYSAAYRFLEAIIFIPTSLSIALFPVLTKLHETNLQQLKIVFYKSLSSMFILGLGAFFIFYFFIPEIIYLLLPNYQPSINIIKILAFAVPFIFLHVPAGQILLSSDRFLKELYLIYFLLIFLNLVLYLIFIDMLGSTGAALVTVISEIMTFLVFLMFIKLKVLKNA